MSYLHISKRHDLINMINDTSWYIDDIFTIDNPEFEKYIPDIYPAELQLNKANTSDKERRLGFKYSNGQKKGYTEYMSTYSWVDLKHSIFLT